MAFSGKRGVDMTINGEPDKNTERTEPAEDEEIIELKEEIESGPEDDDDILDLLDAVEELPIEDQEEIVPTETEESVEDEEIFELTDEIIDTSQNDEEIIDLMDTVAEISIEPDEDEEIIELIPESGDTPTEIKEIGESIFTTDDPSPESDDIPGLESDLFEEPIDFDEKLDKEVSMDPSLKDDFADSLGIELETGEDIPEGSLEAGRISDEQIEAALERVIKKMFYKKIDGILVEVIEKTVKKEIERLKNILLEEESGSEK
jgi:hypothetical protein